MKDVGVTKMTGEELTREGEVTKGSLKQQDIEMKIIVIREIGILLKRGQVEVEVALAVKRGVVLGVGVEEVEIGGGIEMIEGRGESREAGVCFDGGKCCCANNVVSGQNAE